MRIGDRIRSLREKRGKTQGEVCASLGLEQSTLANYEKSRRTPKVDIIIALAKFFHVSTDYLLGNSNDKNAPPSKPTTDLLDALFHDEPELLAKARRIDIKGKINEPGVVATLTEHQKARLKDIIMFTIDEAIRNGRRTLVRIHSSKEGGGGHASPQSS